MATQLKSIQPGADPLDGHLDRARQTNPNVSLSDGDAKPNGRGQSDRPSASTTCTTSTQAWWMTAA